jgi:hypothetical protein
MRALFRAIRHTLRADPPEGPRRDPDWCHSHGKWRKEEEE